MDSLSYLQEKLSHLQQKYPHRSRYCALRMAITSIHALFMRDKIEIVPTRQPLESKGSLNTKSQQDEQNLNIVFDVKGGLGDLLIASNYIYYFSQYISDVPFKLKIHYHSQSLLESFCGKLPNISQISTEKNLSGLLKIELNRFPRITAGNIEKLSAYSPKLGKLLNAWNTFFIHNRKFFDLMPQIDGMSNDYTRLLGGKRINQADIGGLLKISEEYMAPLKYPTPLETQEILQRFGLTKPFITLQRGQSTTANNAVNNKLWSIAYYNKLISLLRQQYPQYQFVQLGTNREGYNEDFDDIDINLRGKTNLEELKVILKHAALHIDCEGGLVHLRHALKGGPSVVLFGPTSPDVYGYKENLNLRSTACPHPCEWITNDWLSRCARRTNKHICMESLTPQFVFEEIKKWTLI